MPPARSGVASAMLNASRELAGLLGITIIGAGAAGPPGQRAAHTAQARPPRSLTATTQAWRSPWAWSGRRGRQLPGLRRVPDLAAAPAAGAAPSAPAEPAAESDRPAATGDLAPGGPRVAAANSMVGPLMLLVASEARPCRSRLRAGHPRGAAAGGDNSNRRRSATVGNVSVTPRQAGRIVTLCRVRCRACRRRYRCGTSASATAVSPPSTGHLRGAAGRDPGQQRGLRGHGCSPGR